MFQRALNKMRTVVSGDKSRYQQDGFDLDLSYITPRVVAMAFPADGVESVYRNDIDDVSKMLTLRHGELRFKVYNLCSERTYDSSKFNNMVNTWSGFPDHHPPPLVLLVRICNSIHKWLSADSLNIAAVHCLAGKGRTGTILASYMLYCGLFQTAGAALNYFALKRSKNNWGVTNPSQRRYVWYAERVFVHQFVPLASVTKKLHRIIMSPLPARDYPGNMAPYYVIYKYVSGKKMKLIGTSEDDGIRLQPKQTVLCWDHLSLQLSEDIVVQIRTKDTLLCYFVFHVAMLESSDDIVYKLEKHEIDVAYKDSSFPPDFAIELYLCNVPSVPLRATPRSLARLQNDRMRMSFSSQIAEGVSQLPIDFWKRDTQFTYDGSILFTENHMDSVNQARTATSTVHNMEKGGYLEKIGGTVRNWKLRWFALSEGMLRYYKSPKHTTPAGAIDLATIAEVEIEKSQPLQASDISFETFVEPPMTADVAAMLLTGNNLWVGCSGGSVHGRNISIFDTTNSQLKAQIKTEAVQCLSLFGGNVWVATADEIQAFDSVFFEPQFRIPTSSVVAMLVASIESDDAYSDSEQVLWVICGDGKISIHGSDVSTVICEESLSRKVYCGCVVDGDVWLGGEREVMVVDSDTLLESVCQTISLPETGQSVISIERIQDQVYVCCLAGSIHVISVRSREIICTIDTGHPIHCSFVLGLDLWIGSVGYLMIVDCAHNRRLIQIKSKTNHRCTQIIAVGRIRCWVATDTLRLCSYMYNNRKPWCFRIVTPGRKYLMNCATPEEREDWVDTLQAAISHRSTLSGGDLTRFQSNRQ